ncbi:hypothetical protein BDV24DRAFT_133834 [Aspergillus arachidicola]|uniref:Uncharacterized protein n=1 Tax=Aspergillus arachidicola TaxID=656916 RepID=A0A5N6Y4M0_9EURO|nr:hypothetical protein BDV24DRAFT_133834 [Aspergillus arachidicola]
MRGRCRDRRGLNITRTSIGTFISHGGWAMERIFRCTRDRDRVQGFERLNPVGVVEGIFVYLVGLSIYLLEDK